MQVALIKGQEMRLVVSQMSRILFSSHDGCFSEGISVDAIDLAKRDRPLGTGLRLQKRDKNGFVALSLILFLVWIMPGKAQAYIMSAEQLVGLMAAKSAKFKTLVITQSTHLVNPQDQETEVVLEEKIWLKTPGFYCSEMISRPDYYGIMGDGGAAYRPDIDMTFYRLFMANNTETILAFLSEIGVKLESVAFTRFDGVIAYRLGEKDLESPKLVIEKESFLPLFLCYWSQAGLGQGMVTIRFADYKKLAKGWYPYEITYFAGEEIVERYVILDLQVNIPIERPLSKIQKESPFFPQGFESSQETSDKKHVEETIELLKEKYR